MTMRMFIFVGLLSFALVACGAQAEDGGSDSDNSNNDAEAASLDYSFSVTINDDMTFTEADSQARNAVIPVPTIEIGSGISSDYFMRVEFDADEITETGEYEVSRVTISFPSDLGESGKVGCGSTDGTPDDVMMTVTEVDENRLSGTFDITLTSCEDFISGDSVDMESINVSAEFSNIPFLREAE